MTDDYGKVADYFYKWLGANKAALGLRGVYYGDQEQIPETPSLCVEPGGMTAKLTGANLRVEVEIGVFLIVYHNRVGDLQATKKECDVLSEAVRKFVHTDFRLADTSIDVDAPLVIHGFVTQVEPGYLRRSGSLMNATRLTWTGLSKVGL